MKISLRLFLIVLPLVFCNFVSGKNHLKVQYLQGGKLERMIIPLNIIQSPTELESRYVRSVKFALLDSISFINNDPDYTTLHSTDLQLDFRGDIKPHSPEYYAMYTVYCLDKAANYYNSLFEGRIDFNSQEEYRDIKVTFGDVPYLTTPSGYIFIPGSNPSPSVFYHEMGHRALWYLEDEVGIKFKGLTHIHMGILEYFTASLNDSPVVGEDALPSKSIRDLSTFYGYPIHDSLSLGAAMKTLEDSYPEEMADPNSNTARYMRACQEAYADYWDMGNNHETGMVVATTLWRIRQHLGQDVTDSLVAQATMDLNEFMEARERFYPPAQDETLRNRIEWYDLYYGLIMTDRRLNDRAGEEYIIEEFRKTGFPVDRVSI